MSDAEDSAPESAPEPDPVSAEPRMSEVLTEAIHSYLYAVPVHERWGDGTLIVKAELRPSSARGMLFLSTTPEPGDGDDKPRLERALTLVRRGFERNEIRGWSGNLDEEPEWLPIRDDAEAGMTLRTLAISLTAEPQGA